MLALLALCCTAARFGRRAGAGAAGWGALVRLVVFFSDTRVPHEVRPARALRYAVTTWCVRPPASRSFG